MQIKSFFPANRTRATFIAALCAVALFFTPSFASAEAFWGPIAIGDQVTNATGLQILTFGERDDLESDPDLFEPPKDSRRSRIGPLKDEQYSDIPVFENPDINLEEIAKDPYQYLLNKKKERTQQLSDQIKLVNESNARAKAAFEERYKANLAALSQQAVTKNKELSSGIPA
jgi:hypothetical protein